jgi:hypothetical protein
MKKEGSAISAMPAEIIPPEPEPAPFRPAQGRPVPRRPGSRARYTGARPRPAGVRACSAALRAGPVVAPPALRAGPVVAPPALRAGPVVAPPALRAGPVVAPPALRASPTPLAALSAQAAPGVADLPRPHLTARGRSVLAACAVIVVTLLWFAAATAAHGQSRAVSPRAVRGVGETGGVPVSQVVVQPGQTLWSIALQADPSADPRLVVQQIVSMNSLTGENVVAGQHLRVPQG